MERVDRLRARRLFRDVAVSSHERTFCPKLGAHPRFDILRIRSDAAHSGAERDVIAEPLTALDDGPLSDEEMTRARRIGEHVCGERETQKGTTAVGGAATRWSSCSSTSGAPRAM
jgi:hypothetical protein